MFEDLFDKYKLNEERALAYGMKKDKDCFFFEQEILDGDFLFLASFGQKGFQFEVRDQETGLEYVLFQMESAKGEFVGQMRQACLDVLLDVRSSCFDRAAYRCPQTDRLLTYIRQQYGGHVDYLWAHSPQSGAIRHKESKKWYGVLMTVDWSKLDPRKTGLIEVLNLKQDQVPELLTQTGIYPAYHMNKKYWISLPLDDSLDDSQLHFLIEKSWNLTKK